MSSGWRAFGAHVARWGSSVRLLCGIEQIVWLCNDNDSQLKGIASFLSHFSSSVTASQPLKPDRPVRKPGDPVPLPEFFPPLSLGRAPSFGAAPATA
jgi:hypothetical protein